MSLSNVRARLTVLGITAKKMGIEPESDFNELVTTMYYEQTDRMRTYLNYGPGEAIPRPLEHIVDDWTVGKIIATMRLRDPEYGLYLQTIAEGHVVRKYAPKGGYFVTDPSSAMDAVPWAEIVQYRRLTRKPRGDE